VPLQCIRSGVTQAIVLPHACLVSEISGVENLKKDKSDKACGTSYRLLEALQMTIQRWNESHRHIITRSPSLEGTAQMELKSYEFKVRGLVWYSGGPKGVRRWSNKFGYDLNLRSLNFFG
jgi:hypothetical protein